MKDIIDYYAYKHRKKKQVTSDQMKRKYFKGCKDIIWTNYGGHAYVFLTKSSTKHQLNSYVNKKYQKSHGSVDPPW